MKTSIATVSLSRLPHREAARLRGGQDSTVSRSSNPTSIAGDHTPRGDPAAWPTASGRVAGPLPAAARHRGRRRGDLRRQPAPRRRHLRHRAAARHRHASWCAAMSPPRPSTPTRCPPDQLRRMGDLAAGLRHQGRLRGAGLGPLRRRLPPRLARSSSSPTTRPSGSAWTASTCCPAGTTPRRSRTSPATRSSTCSWPTRRRCTMDVLSWSRHHRLFPGRGQLRPGRLRAAHAGRRVRRAAVAGGLQRHLPPDRPGPHRGTRACARCVWLQDQVLATRLLPSAKPPTGFDFVEIKAEDTSEVEVLLRAARLHPAGHGTAPSRYRCGSAGTPGWSSTNNRPATRCRTSRPSVCRCPTPRPPRGAPPS